MRKEILNKLKDANPKLSYSIVLEGKEKGPHLMIFGSVHGNEPAGTMGFFKFQEELDKSKATLQKGKLTFVLGNPLAFEKDVRFIDENLNRAFPGSQDTYEGKRAKEISEYIETNEIEALLDIHSLGHGDFKLVIYNVESEKNQHLARSISPIVDHFAYHLDHVSGLLVEKATQHGASSMVIETGNHTNPEGALVALNHLKSFLAHYQLIGHQFAPTTDFQQSIGQQETCIYETLRILKPTPGFRFTVDFSDDEVGTLIPKDSPYAQDNKRQYIAERDLYLVMPHKEITYEDHDVGFICIKKTI